MSPSRFALIACAVLLGPFHGARAESDCDSAICERRPTPRSVRYLVTAECPPEGNGMYFAFPTVLDLGQQILISYKHGETHLDDPYATLNVISYNPETGETSPQSVIAQRNNRIMAMGEWVRFPNGDIAVYIDVQQKGAQKRRGIRTVRSSDGGCRFDLPTRLGLIDGIEYGYPFDAIRQGNEVWMLAMSFKNLTGGMTTDSPNHGEAGQVDVIHTQDNGRSWTRIGRLTHGDDKLKINESAFVASGDGFVVAMRDYNDRARLHRFDAHFRPLERIDLTKKYPFITREIGRPRLFAREGNLYLLARNYTVRDGPMQLCLFRLNAATLDIESYAILDNVELKDVKDGYYAMGVFRGSGSETRFHVITYKGDNDKRSSIIAFEYLWSDVH